jgi:hypothetical protein
MGKDRQTPLYKIVLQKSGFVQQKCINLAESLSKPAPGARKSIFLPQPQGVKIDFLRSPWGRGKRRKSMSLCSS